MTTTNPLLPLAALAAALNDYYSARDLGPDTEIPAAQILIRATLATMSQPRMPDDMEITLMLRGEDIKAIYNALNVAAEDALY